MKRLGALLVVVVGLVAATLVPHTASAASDVPVVRLAGPDRYATAQAVAAAAFPSARSAIVVSGDAYPDALAASFLRQPVLLTAADHLSPGVVDQLHRLGATDVRIVGGAGAVSAVAESSLRQQGFSVTRIAGVDRYETASAVASVAAAGDTAIVATGESFADALAAGPLSGAARMPIVLTPAKLLTARATSALARFRHVLIVGGTGAVSANVETSIRALGIDVRRVAGTTRRATAVRLAELARAEHGFTSTRVILARGDAFADALAGGGLGAVQRVPLLLTAGTSLGDETRADMRAHHDDLTDIEVLGGQAAVPDAVVDEALGKVAPRIAALWPFASDSPWNLPIGAGAQYEDAGAPRTASLTMGGLTWWANAGQYSHPVYVAGESDPMVTMTRPGHEDVHFRLPAGATPAAGTDRHLHVVDPSGRWLDESWDTQGVPPLLTTGYHVRTDLYGPGVGQGGVRAYGGSAIGGLIRTWELDAGSIRHAIALGITGDQLKSGPVWPATAQDGNASGYHGGTPMGTLAAIPPSVDVSGLGLSPAGLALARALQDYGAYVVDQTYGCVCVFAEPSTEGTSAIDGLRRDLPKLRTLLRVVANSSAATPGGGGERRAALAPPLG